MTKDEELLEYIGTNTGRVFTDVERERFFVVVYLRAEAKRFAALAAQSVSVDARQSLQERSDCLDGAADRVANRRHLGDS